MVVLARAEMFSAALRGLMRITVGPAEWVLFFSELLLRCREDFYEYQYKSLRQGQKTFPSVVDAALDFRARLQQLNVSGVFIASNGRKLELELYKAVLQGTLHFTRSLQPCFGYTSFQVRVSALVVAENGGSWWLESYKYWYKPVLQSAPAHQR